MSWYYLAVKHYNAVMGLFVFDWEIRHAVDANLNPYYCDWRKLAAQSTLYYFRVGRELQREFLPKSTTYCCMIRDTDLFCMWIGVSLCI